MKNILLIIALFSVSFVLCQNNLSLAESYFREGEYEKATQLYESLEKNNPYNTRYLKRLITCYQETNNYEKASELLQKKLLNNPSQHYLRIEVGYNFDQQKKRNPNRHREHGDGIFHRRLHLLLQLHGLFHVVRQAIENGI